MSEHEPSIGETSEWYTPKEIFDALNLTFDLDPASPGAALCHVPARWIFTKAGDGLVQPWHGLIWLNPPFGGRRGQGLMRLWRGAGRSICAVVLAAVAGVAHADGDPIRGEQRYADCIACHSLERDIHGVGPSLHGVFGRQAGELADFRYSPALKRSGIIWTAETMDAFIADPQRFVPLNRMPYDGMPNEADRADLIAYLRKASK
jgi:cytochrome c